MNFTDPRTGTGIKKRFSCSSRRSPCPVCSRTHDHDCRWSDDLILCHSGSNLPIGRTLTIAGQEWALVATDAGHSGCAAKFKPHTPREHAGPLQRRKKTVQALSSAMQALQLYHQLRPCVHAALRVLEPEQGTLAEFQQDLIYVEATFKRVQELHRKLLQNRRQVPHLRKILPISGHWIKALGYQLDDLKRFDACHLGTPSPEAIRALQESR